MVESLFSKVTKTSAFCNSAEKRLTRARYVPKSSSSRISRSPFLTKAESLQYTFCNATKYELLTKFLEGAFKLTENFQKVVLNAAPYQKFTACKLQLLALRVFKIPEITSTVEFLSSEAGA